MTLLCFTEWITFAMSMEKTTLNTIEEAIEDIRNGKMVIVVDDEDRENEGDFLTAAENMTTEMALSKSASA